MGVSEHAAAAARGRTPADPSPHPEVDGGTDDFENIPIDAPTAPANNTEAEPPGFGFGGVMTRSPHVLLGCFLGAVAVWPTAAHARGDQAPAWIRSAKGGPWSAAATWQGGKVPPA